MPGKKKILIVEDEGVVAEDIKNALEKSGYLVAGRAASYDETLKLFSEKNPDLVLMDIELKHEKSGIDAGEWIRESGPEGKRDVQIIYLTAHKNYHKDPRLKATMPSAYITKPFEKDDVIGAINKAFSMKYSK